MGSWCLGVFSVLQQVPRLAMEAEGNPGSQELPIRAALQIFQVTHIPVLTGWGHLRIAPPLTHPCMCVSPKALGCPGKLLVFHAALPSDGTLTCGPSGFLRSAKPKACESHPCLLMDGKHTDTSTPTLIFALCFSPCSSRRMLAFHWLRSVSVKAAPCTSSCSRSRVLAVHGQDIPRILLGEDSSLITAFRCGSASRMIIIGSFECQSN